MIWLNFAFSQSEYDLLENREFGSCYAKCMIENQFEWKEEVYPIYIGDDLSSDNIETIEIILNPKSEEWVKKKADSNCLSSNPEDCLVWCLVEIPEEMEEITIVIDTTLTDEYVLEYFTSKIITSEDKHTEWRKVVCKDNMDEYFINSIQRALAIKNFYDGYETGKLDVTTKTALTKYQKENGLPVGSLDEETIEALGLEFPD